MIDIEAECERLTKEQDQLREQIARSKNTLANENFVTKAPQEVVEGERRKLAELEASVTQIEERLGELCG